MSGSLSAIAPRKPSPPTKPAGVMTPVNDVLPITGTPGSWDDNSSSMAGVLYAQLEYAKTTFELATSPSCSLSFWTTSRTASRASALPLSATLALNMTPS